MGDATVRFHREPDDTRSTAGADGIKITLEIVDHEGEEHAIEVGLVQEGNGPIEFWAHRIVSGQYIGKEPTVETSWEPGPLKDENV